MTTSLKTTYIFVPNYRKWYLPFCIIYRFMKNYFSPLQPGKVYHIYNRGNNHENIFFNAENYAYFLRKYFMYIAPVAYTYAYCLLPNHFHIAVKIKSKAAIRESILAADNKQIAGGKLPYPTLSILEQTDIETIVGEVFRRFLLSYSKSINKQRQRDGSLFQKNFKRLEVTSARHFNNLVRYIHTNPQLHKLIEDFAEWPYSSYLPILNNCTPYNLEREEIIKYFGGIDTFSKQHKEYIDWKLLEYLYLED